MQQCSDVSLGYSSLFIIRFVTFLNKCLQSQGVDIIHFGFGQSPFPIPSEMVARLPEFAHVHDYLRKIKKQYMKKSTSVRTGSARPKESTKSRVTLGTTLPLTFPKLKESKLRFFVIKIAHFLKNFNHKLKSMFFFLRILL